MIQARVVQHLHHRMDGPRFRVVRPVHYALYPGMHQGACAHRAWLNCNKELAVFQTVVTQVRAGLPKGDNLSVRRGIGVRKIAIPASADDLARMDHDSTHGNFARFQRALGRAESLFHPEFIKGSRGLLVVGHSSLVSSAIVAVAAPAWTPAPHRQSFWYGAKFGFGQLSAISC